MKRCGLRRRYATVVAICRSTARTSLKHQLILLELLLMPIQHEVKRGRASANSLHRWQSSQAVGVAPDVRSAPRSRKATRRGRKGRLPLHMAAQHLSLECAQMIFRAYPEAAQKQDNHGSLPMHYACYDGRSKAIILWLLEAYPEGMHIKNNQGWYPFHTAFHHGMLPLPIFKELYDHNTEAMTTRDIKGRTPLTVLFEEPRTAITKVLVDFVCQEYPDVVTIADEDGKLPLHHLCPAIINNDYNGKESPFISVIFKDTISRFPQGMYQPDNSGKTPLSYLFPEDVRRGSPRTKFLFPCFVMGKERFFRADLMNHTFYEVLRSQNIHRTTRSAAQLFALFAPAPALHAHDFELNLRSIEQEVPGALAVRDLEDNTLTHLVCFGTKHIVSIQQLQTCVHVREDEQLFEWNDWMKVCLRFLPNSASRANASGELPLHLRLKYGARIFKDRDARALIEAHPSSKMVVDPTNGLFPFQLAALGSAGCVTATFELLKRCIESNNLDEINKENILRGREDWILL
jgi:hypothetical protein